MLELLRASLWGTDPGIVTQDIYEEMERHCITILPAVLLSSLNISSDLRNVWKKTILRQINYYNCYKYVQETLPIDVPYVILKGTSAAKYYPYPEYRTLGDIDIMTRREDYTTACDMLLRNGFLENTATATEDFGRHRGFIKNNIEVEVHAFFALLNDPEKARYLDDLIIQNITPSHILPDMVNGLTLLEHINQHLEEGLGLRQIIDWMMFVNKCLSDKEWPEFSIMARNIGLEKLAIITTQMCVNALGLSPREWCSGAEKKLCEQLFDYVLSCGNFGIKNKEKGDSNIVTNVFTYARTPAAGLRLLQKRGLVNWSAAQKHKFLRPFSWIYQAGRYIIRGFHRNEAAEKVRKEYKAAKERIMLFDDLGVKQTAKGLARLENGYYVKTYQKP